MKISLDGQVKVDRPLSTGEPGKGPWKSAKFLSQWKVWVSDYAEDIAIEVPAGQHDLTLANTEGDWLQIRSILLPGYRSSRYPNLNVLGLESDQLLLLWVHNPESTWRTEYDGKKPQVQKAIRALVPAADGTWQVEWWDTFKGEIVRRKRSRPQAEICFCLFRTSPRMWLREWRETRKQLSVRIVRKPGILLMTWQGARLASSIQSVLGVRRLRALLTPKHIETHLA